MTAGVFPVALALEGRAVLVVGTGAELFGRVKALLDAGAAVTAVSADPGADVEALAGSGVVTLRRRAFTEADLDGTWLAVLADRDAATAARIAPAAEARRVFFCAVDEPTHSSFWHMALARAGSVVVAISTGSRAPALARRLRQELERVFDDAGLAAFAERIAALRDRTPSAERRDVLARALAGLSFKGLTLPPAPSSPIPGAGGDAR